MLFEVETKDYIKVNIDDVDVLIGAAKILKKRLSPFLKEEYEGFYRYKGQLFGVNEFHDKSNLEEKYGKKISERDLGLINNMLDLENEALALSHSPKD